jgi:hypothetical protein
LQVGEFRYQAIAIELGVNVDDQYVDGHVC